MRINVHRYPQYSPDGRYVPNFVSDIFARSKIPFIFISFSFFALSFVLVLVLLTKIKKFVIFIIVIIIID